MKMKMIKMRNVFAFCMGCLALLAGCAGFTEDVNGNIADHSDEANQIESQYALARVAQSGKVERSAAGDSITIVLEINGGCVKEGESFAYDENFYFADSLTFAYSFRGDTLLLSKIREPDPYEADQERYEESFIFVGGTAGKLDGIWKNTQCRYREEKMYCMNDGYDQFFKFDGDKVEYRVTDRVDYDYMQTVFVDQLFDFIGDGGSIQLETPYYYSDTKYEQEYIAYQRGKRCGIKSDNIYQSYIHNKIYYSGDHCGYADIQRSLIGNIYSPEIC